QLLVTSSSLTEDIYKGFLKPNASPKQLLINSRLSVLIVAAVALLLALNPKDSILNLIGNAWAGFGAAFGPLVILALLQKKSTWQGALSGMIVGGITVLSWVYFDHPLSDCYEIILGFILSLLTNLLVSKFIYKPVAEIDEEFQKVDEILKK